MKQVLKYSEWIIFFLIVAIFCYFRLKPILLETVGYTYDQGRDFLKAAEIAVYKNPTFIGPTTGIMGIYHGAWWYFLLAVGFIIFQGLPIGFYYFNFAIQSITFLAFYYFSRRYFDKTTALILALIIATAPYLIFGSIFIANNVMALAVFPLLLINTVLILEKKKLNFLKTKIPVPLLFTAGIFLGLTAEFEFAFGLLLTPIYIILLLAFNYWQKLFSSIKQYALFLIGLLLPFSLRILFELKNSFPQTKMLLSFITNPEYKTPKPFNDILNDRISLFQGYYNGLFLNDMTKIFFSILVIIFIGIFLYKRKFSPTFIFMSLLGILLFVAATLYKDTFWTYYYDGIQYLILMLVGFFFSTTIPFFKNQIKTVKIMTLSIILILAIAKISTDVQSAYVYDGIKVQQDIVNYIAEQEKDTPFCVRVYTPPVVPYTYDYLFFYKEYSESRTAPTVNWQNKKCWYILEYDDYKERKQKWITEQLPAEATRISTKRIKDVDIELWQVK